MVADRTISADIIKPKLEIKLTTIAGTLWNGWLTHFGSADVDWIGIWIVCWVSGEWTFTKIVSSTGKCFRTRILYWSEPCDLVVGVISNAFASDTVIWWVNVQIEIVFGKIGGGGGRSGKCYLNFLEHFVETGNGDDLLIELLDRNRLRRNAYCGHHSQVADGRNAVR